MATTDAQKRANKKYQETHSQEIKEYRKEYEQSLACYKVRMTQEQKELVKSMADAEGKSLNQFIVDRITKQ